MSILIYIIIVIVVLALVVYMIQSFMPGDPRLKNLLIVVAILLAILLIVNHAGLLT